MDATKTSKNETTVQNMQDPLALEFHTPFQYYTGQLCSVDHCFVLEYQ